MKLLCVIPSYWPAIQYGGPIYSVHNLNKAMVKKGVNITVYTTNVGLNNRVPVNQEVDVEGMRVIYFTFIKFFEVLGLTGWQFSLSLATALRENLKNFDIVHIISVWNYPVACAAYYCRKYKKPYLITPSGHLYPDAFGKKAWKKLPYYYLVSKRDLYRAAAIHYTTEDEAEKSYFYPGLKNKRVIISNGIDLSEFRDLPKKESLSQRYPDLKDKKVILFLGRISWIKGLDILLKAYVRLSRERNDVHLLIVGNDSEGYGKRLKQWISDYAIGPRVTFTGMLTGKEKLEAYVGSDVFVLPSYSENFGMSVIEAMACGIPVVITDKVGISGDLQENHAGVIVECNEDSIYQGIRSILDNENLAQELSLNGNKMVEKYYSIEKVADKMIKIYEEVLK